MPNADQILYSQRAKIALLERDLEVARAELRGMEALAAAIGSALSRASSGVTLSVGGKVVREPSRKGGHGRQPGSISQRWRLILATLLMVETDWFSSDAVVRAVELIERRTIKPSEVRRLFDGYRGHGFIELNEHGQFRITDAAIDKFVLREIAAHENEASPAKPEEASDAEEVGASSTDNRSGFRLVG